MRQFRRAERCDALTALRSASCLNSQRGDGMDGENYQAMFVCGHAAAWDKPRSERAGGPLAVVAAVGRCRIASGKMMSAAFCRKPLHPVGNENLSRVADPAVRDDRDIAQKG